MGSSPPTKTPTLATYFDERVSFSNPPVGTDPPPALSAPVGYRSILAEVRATHPSRPPKPTALRNSKDGVPARSSSAAAQKLAKTPEVPPKERTETMGRGYVGGRSADITAFAWLSSVKVGPKRDASSGGDSGTQSRINSRSRPPSIADHSMSYLDFKTKSGSRDRGDEERRDVDANQSLQEE